MSRKKTREELESEIARLRADIAQSRDIEQKVERRANEAYQELVAAREFVMGPEVRDHTNKAIRNLAWALRVHLGVSVRASDDPSGRDGEPRGGVAP